MDRVDRSRPFIDCTRHDFADGERRYDLILDIGGDTPLARLRQALTETGTLVIVGGEGRRTVARRPPPPPAQSPPVVPLRGTEDASLRLEGEPREHARPQIKELIEAGDITPVVDTTYPLTKAPDAIRHVEQGLGRGKVVVTV